MPIVPDGARTTKSTPNPTPAHPKGAAACGRGDAAQAEPGTETWNQN